MKKNILLTILIAVGVCLPINAMNQKGIRAIGAVQTVAGGAMTVLGAAGLSNAIALTAPAGVIAGGLVGGGVIAVATALEKLFPKGEVKIKAGQVLIKFIDPATGKETSQQYSGADIDKFLRKNGFMISWRQAYPVQREYENAVQSINTETMAIQRQYGRPFLHGAFVNINNPELRAQHVQIIENLPGSSVDIMARDLALRENLFSALRRVAIYSFGTPNHTDNLSLFANEASKVMAKLTLVTAAAYTFPYEELVRDEQAARNRLQHEFNREREERNQLQQNLNQSQATLAQTQAALQAEESARRITIQFALEEGAELERAILDFEELRQDNQDNEILLESYRNRIIRIADMNRVTLAQANERTNEVEERAVQLQNGLQQATQRLSQERAVWEQEKAALMAKLTSVEEKARKKSEKNKNLHRQLSLARNPQHHK